MNGPTLARSDTAYCTLFDSRYFSRGMAMCESLLRHAPGARIYVYAMDEACRDACVAWALPGVTIVPLEELLQDTGLATVRSTRGWAEFCWTATPCSIRHTLAHYREAQCTYVDADVFFFNSPSSLLDELGDACVMITEHRFTPAYDQSASSGIYNVQFMPFRASGRGRAILEWWRSVCLESCELNPAEGKCGDQKYLDDWTTRFEGVHVMRNLGGGVAPWNVQQYIFRTDAQGSIIGETETGVPFLLIFYHFHAFKMTSARNVRLTNAGYSLDATVVDLIYRPYVRYLLNVERRLKALGFGFDPHGLLIEPTPSMPVRLKRLTCRALQSWPGHRTVAGNANRVYHTSEL